ncbi:MAG: DUF4390 domain-containing protein [Gammaproteobacteria bacterium]|nr:DUF4390 domain-containing protein [Gammaproteobacteria bacterium]
MCTQKQLTCPSLWVHARALHMAVFLIASVLVSPALFAAGNGVLNIRDAHAWHDNDGWFLDAQYDIRLSSGAQEALENGVPLVFELRAQIVKTHKWFWDVVEFERTQRRQLQYHALSRSYLVKDIASGSQGVYSQLDDALFAVGLIDALHLTDATLDSKRQYVVRLRGSHDIESLPTPVRLLAYVSSEWDMNSQWYTWPLAR